jgi:hypothetical protein
MKPTVYIETTIPSYLVARPSRDIVLAGHQVTTQEWWDQRRHGFELFISPLVYDEARMGEPEMAAKRLNALKGIESLALTMEAQHLAEKLFLRLNLPDKAKADAYHIAIAAVYGIDFLLTWNCKHINNLQHLHRIEALCRAEGFTAPVIGTPEEL